MSTIIKDEVGNLLTEPDEVRQRWKEYIETLYDKNGKPRCGDMELEVQDEVRDNDQGPGLLDSKIRKAIQEMTIGKAVGPDEIPADFCKVLGDKGTMELVGLCKYMNKEGLWPIDFTRVLMIHCKRR